MAPPLYSGGVDVSRPSLLQPTAARTSPAASDMRRIVIVGLPLKRVAQRHPEQVRVEVVETVVQGGRRGAEQWLSRAAAPVVLSDVLIREIGAQVVGQLDRGARRKLITLCLRQERRDGLGGGGAIVMQIAAAVRPLRVFGP